MQGISILASIISISLIISIALMTQYGIGINKQYIAIIFLDKNLKPIDNVFYQLFAFYPSDKGTVFKEISRGFIKANPAIATISLSDLKDIAKAWYDKYHDVLHPSLIGFASYMENESGNIVLRTQSFTINYDPLKILNGIGMTKTVAFIQAKTLILNKNTNNPAYTTTTTVPQWFCRSFCVFQYELDKVVYYPSSNSLAPIPLIEVDASAVGSLYQQYIFGSIHVFMQGSPYIEFSVVSVSEGIDVYGFGISYDIAGDSIIMKPKSNSVSKTSLFGYWSYSRPLTQDIYVMAQLALAGYNVYYCDPFGGVCIPYGYSLQTFATALEVTSSDPNTSLPVLYTSPTLYVPFNWTYAKYYGYVAPGSYVHIPNLQVSNNVFPGLTLAISPAELFASFLPEFPAIASSIVPHLAIASQSFASIFELVVSINSPVGFDIWYEDSGVQYQYNGQNYTLPHSIFLVKPTQGSKPCLIYNCSISNTG